MMTAAETMDRARPIVAALVDREQRQSLSQMIAYERVALRIGAIADAVGCLNAIEALTSYVNDPPPSPTNHGDAA